MRHWITSSMYTEIMLAKSYFFIAIIFGGALMATQIQLGLNQALGQELALGVPEFESDLNLIKSQSVAATVVRSLILSGLTKVRESGEAGLMLAQSYSVDPSGRDWTFRISDDLKFSSGQPITGEDVIMSIDECRSAGRLSEIESAKSSQDSENYQGSFDVVISLRSSNLDNYRKFPIRLADCPIVAADAKEIFGNYWGLGNNLVSSGPYVVARFKHSKEIQLTINENFSGRRPKLEQLVVRAMPSPQHGLTALRLGTIVSLFTDRSDILQESGNDQTLLIETCPVGKVIARKSFKFTCSSSMMDFSDAYFFG